jgi:hypothetical protein
MNKPALRLRLLCVLGVGLLWNGCATTRRLLGDRGPAEQTWHMSTSPRVPAAEGTLRVSRGSDRNARLTIEVQHLAEPNRVFDDSTCYVVWVVPPKGPPQNMGVLTVGEKLTGRFTTQVPYPSFRVVVTSETQPSVTQPNFDHQIMSADVQLPS